jgi:hypothetical protein
VSALQPPAPLATTVGSARDRGLDRNHLRTRRFWHPYRNVYVDARVADDLASRCAALRVVLPSEARFSHQTAAALYAAPVGACSDEIHVSVPAGVVVPRRRPGLATHQRVLDTEPVLLDALSVTCPEQTFLDLAPSLPTSDLVVLGDYLVNGWVSPESLARHLRERPRTRGVVRARDALGLVRPGTDSPQETRLRLRVVAAGLPEPAVNKPAFDPAGEWLGTPDLGYEEYLVAIQYDGDVHRTNPRRWRQDVARDEGFRDAGWAVLRAVAEDVARPSVFLQRLTRTLRERGWRPEGP